MKPSINISSVISQAVLALLVVLLAAQTAHAQHLEWHPANGPISSTYYAALVARNGSIYVGGTNGIFRTTDGGKFWTERLIYAGDPLTRILFEDATGTLFADGPDYRPARSRDSGKTWRSVVGLNTSGYGAFAAGSNNRIFAIGSGLEYSDDTGTSWHRVPDTTKGLSFITSIIAVGENDLVASIPYVFNPGIYRSSDNGLTWHIVAGTGRFSPSQMVRTKSGMFLAVSYNGLLRFPLSALGDTSQVNTSIIGISALALDSSGAVLAGTYGRGVFRSTDNGATWDTIGLLNHTVRSIAVTRQGDLVAACDSGVWIRAAGSADWKIRSHGLVSPSFSDLFVTHSGKVIYAGTADGMYVLDPKAEGGLEGQLHHNDSLHGFQDIVEDRTGTLYGNFDDQIWRSLDDGETWHHIFTKSSSSQTFGVTADDRVYFGYYDTLWMSSDKGVSFDRRPSTTVEYYRVRPLTDSIYLMTAYNRLSRSTDRGVTWDQVLSDEAFVQTEWLRGEEVLYASHDTIVYRTADYGATWRADTAKFHFSYILNAGKGELYASSWKQGVFHSLDSGHTWTKEVTGIQDTVFDRLFLRNGILFLATEGGMYYAKTSQAGVRPVTTRPASDILLSAFPSPASTRQLLTITSSNPRDITVSLVDASGRFIGQLFEGHISHSLVLPVDLSSLPAGRYYYLVRSGGGESVLGIVVMK